MQVPAQARPEWSQAAAVRMVEDGWTDRQIATHFGIDLNTMTKRIDYAVAHYEPPQRMIVRLCAKCGRPFMSAGFRLCEDPCRKWANSFGGRW